jgi:rhodanese-related sulfurtransferase
VDGLLPPLAGAEGVPLAGFLALDLAGSFLWSGVYTGLGYVFSNELDAAARLIDHFGAVVSVAVAVPIGFYAAWRGLAMLRMIHRLRLRRISPSMLERKLKSGRNIAVLDLLQFEETDTERSEVIPGSVRLDPARLRRSPHLTIPRDIEMIFYSSSGGDAVSARAAMGLKRIGINNVWVSEGGLRGWRQMGFPVSPSPEKAEVVAERLGIKLPEASFE